MDKNSSPIKVTQTVLSGPIYLFTFHLFTENQKISLIVADRAISAFFWNL